MKRWQDEFSRLPIHANLKVLEDAANFDHPIDDPNLVAERTRFLKVIGLAKKIIADIDPDIAPIDILSSLNSNLTQSGVMNSIKGFASTGNANHFADANAQITTALAYLYQLETQGFNRRSREADREAASSAFESFSRRIDQKYTEATAKLEHALSEVLASRQEVEALSKEAKDASAQFTAKLSEWNTQASESLASAKNELSDVLSKGRISFNEAVSTLKSETNASLQSFFLEQSTEAEMKQSALSNDLNNISEDAKSKHAEILRFYELVTHDSVTGGHKNVADRELIAAENWRRAAVGSIFVTVVWLGCALLWFTPELQPERLFWLQIGKSIGLTALLVSFAVYASKQSTLHRLNEQRAREFFLQVQAFDPFIASLPEDQRWAMKTAMTERIFQKRSDGEVEGSGIKDADFKGLDQVLSFLERLKSTIGWK